MFFLHAQEQNIRIHKESYNSNNLKGLQAIFNMTLYPQMCKSNNAPFLSSSIYGQTLIESWWTKPVGSVKQAQFQAGYSKKSERAMGVVMVSPPMALCQKGDVMYRIWSRIRLPRIGSVHAVIRQACTNWAGPVRIQIYYGLEERGKAVIE